MKYLKRFNEGVIDYINQQHLTKNADNLTILDIVKGIDIYCGNHIDKENNKICGYYFGEIDDNISKDVWAKEILKEKCPDCGMQPGKKVTYISQKDLNEFEENLPGEGFYIFPKSYEKL